MYELKKKKKKNYQGVKGTQLKLQTMTKKSSCVTMYDTISLKGGAGINDADQVTLVMTKDKRKCSKVLYSS